MAHFSCAPHLLGTVLVSHPVGFALMSNTVHRPSIQDLPGAAGPIVELPFPKHARYKEDLRERDRVPAVRSPLFVRSIHHHHGRKLRHRVLCSLEPHETSLSCWLVELVSVVAKEVAGNSKVAAVEAGVVLARRWN